MFKWKIYIHERTTIFSPHSDTLPTAYNLQNFEFISIFESHSTWHHIIVMAPLIFFRPPGGSSILLVSWIEALRLSDTSLTLCSISPQSSFTALFIHNLYIHYQCVIISHLPCLSLLCSPRISESSYKHHFDEFIPGFRGFHQPHFISFWIKSNFFNVHLQLFTV